MSRQLEELEARITRLEVEVKAIRSQLNERLGPVQASARPLPIPARETLRLALFGHRGNVWEVALDLGGSPPLIYRWCKWLGLDPREYRPKNGD